MALLTESNLAQAEGGMGIFGVKVSQAQRALILGIAARLAWHFIRENWDNPSPLKVLFIRIPWRKLAFVVELLFGPDPDRPKEETA